MSALTKPLIKPTVGVGGSVNIELAQSVETMDIPAVPDGAAARYFIVFTYPGAANKVMWEYAASAARNTEFAAINTLATTTIV